ncbi:MAG: dTMP kinase [Bacteroidetes bacterium]|nr:dTMP kinase [Bacteroidota bacterium]
MNQNLFIAFEGIDGSGKSTQAEMLAAWMESTGRKVWRTAEPTKRPVGKMIRDIFSGKQIADQKVIAGLFVADRLDHLLNEDDGMLLKLKNDFCVITDRYYLSSYAYHSVHMDMDWVIQANAMSARLLRPDVHIFIDVPPEVSMQRIQSSRSETEMYENLENLKKVRETYLLAIKKVGQTENILRFDGTMAPDQLAKQIQEAIKKLG